MQRIAKLPNTAIAHCDQCCFGMRVTRGTTTGLAKKATGFTTNCPALVHRLSKRCDGSHEHLQLIGGIAWQAAVYPPRLVMAVLQGLADHLRGQGSLDSFDNGGPTVDEPPPENEWIN